MKDAQIIEYDDGRTWIACPYCGKRMFPLGTSTRIEHLRIKCKDHRCGRFYMVNYKNPKEVTTNVRHEG